MSNEKQPVQLHHQHLSKIKELHKAFTVSQTLQILQQILQIFDSLDLATLPNIKNFVYEFIKPVARQASNISITLFPDSINLLRKIFHQIIMLYCRICKNYYMIDGLQLLKELLGKSTGIFKLKLEDNMQEKTTDIVEEQEIKVQDFPWVRQHLKKEPSSKTPFFYKCCNDIINQFEVPNMNLKAGNINFIKEYCLFLDYMEWYIKLEKTQSMVESLINELEEIFDNPEDNKEFCKDINFQGSERLMISILKISRQSNHPGIKKRVEIMGSTYAKALLFTATSIQKKMNALKMLNKWARHFTANPQAYTKEDDYVRWMLNSKIIDFILENGKNITIIKSCNDMIRLFLRRKCMGYENFNKLFECILHNSVAEVRQLIFKYMDMEAIKLEYQDYEFLIEKFSIIQKGEFYEEEMFNLLSQIVRYTPYYQSKKLTEILGNIVTQSWGTFKNQRIRNKCLNTFVKAASKMIDKKNDLEEKIMDVYALYDQYMAKPCSLGIKLIKNIINGLPEVAYLSKNKAALKLLQEKNILREGILLLKEGIDFKQELSDFICFLLSHAKDSYQDKKLVFEDQIYFLAIGTPNIFQNMLEFLGHSSENQQLFENLVNRFQVDGFPFICLKLFFYKLNRLYANKIRQPYADNQYELSITADKLTGFDNICYLLKQAKNPQARNQIADFISQLFTIYREEATVEGEKELKYLMEKTIHYTLKFYEEKEENVLLGSLASIQYIMMATQTLGTGLLKPHNSLVSTSTVTIKVFNEITDYSDVLKVFQKKMPSNMLVFELIEELSKQFKCSPCQIMFREGGKTIPDKWNGLTLEQVQFDGKIISAVKSFRQRIRREQLLINDELTPKAKRAFQQIYNNFAVDGKMGKRQCANYVEGVTRTSCYINDDRVLDFFREWDQDNDENITINDFLRFYKSNCVPLKNDIVWRNLAAMKFRKNLNKYDQPIDPPSNDLLFRYHLCQQEKIYKLLFDLSKSQHEQLRQRSIRILFRLPTCPFVLNQLSQNLNLLQKNEFETEYLLIAIIQKLNSYENKEESIKSLVQSQNPHRIFEMIERIDKISNQTSTQTKCMYISLRILRYLSSIPDLRGQISDEITIKNELTLPENKFFQKLIKKALSQMDFEVLESSLILQLSQKQLQMEGIIEAAFHEQIQIRKMICNYIFICEKLGKIEIDLFNVQVTKNCESWFYLLEKIIYIKENLKYEEIIRIALKGLETRLEDIVKNPEDKIIFGNLSVINRIISMEKIHISDNLTKALLGLADRVISSKNRQMIYHILSQHNPEFTFAYIEKLLASVTPRKEIAMKNHFVGIKNLGSTCYMNSILQILFQVKEFRSLIFQLQNQSGLVETEVEGHKFYDDILYQLQKMYANFQLSTRQHYNPSQFCLTIKDPTTNKPINPNIQEDVHEFTGRFLETLEKYLKEPSKLEKFKKIFEGKTLTQFTCKECHNKIIREQNFCQLSLEVKNHINLQKSFQKFIQAESITDYFCEQCQKKVERIERSTYLSSLPKILIVNLRRIIFDLETFRNVKVDSTFKFPQNLDVSEFTSKQATNLTHQDCLYQLKAIVVHSGTSESGHYYSIIRLDSQWYKFNDQSVSKFDLKDLPREAYGGTEIHDQWSDELKFSTNAYILIYEKIENQCSKQFDIAINPLLVKQIQDDNSLFYKQLQVHQDSIFEFVLNYYEKIRPVQIVQKIKYEPFQPQWSSMIHKNQYQLVYNLIQRLLNFLQVFYEIKTQLLFKIGTYLYQLYYLLPEKSYDFIMKSDCQFIIDNLCLHNDETVRNIYGSIIPKCFHVYQKYYGISLKEEQPNEQTKILINFLENLYSYMKDERLFKNIYKSYKYFETLKICCEYIPQTEQYLQERQILVTLVDILMGNDSPLAEKDKKRFEIPQYQSISIIQLICHLMKSKNNLVDYTKPSKKLAGVTYTNMTEKQKQMLGNVEFYKKMIKNRVGTDILANITGKLAEKDEAFSKKLVELFLKALNCSYDQIQSSLLMINVNIDIFQHLRQYLLIDDEYTEKRMKWVLGIPQLEIGDNQNYGVRFCDESSVYNYVSTLFFIQNDQYQPALEVLFLKKSIYTQFSIEGICLLLQLLCDSQNVFNYIMNLPAPTYLYKCYPDWIEDFIMRLKQQDSYYLQIDKNTAYNRLHNLYKKFIECVNSRYIDIPVNKFIIGINKECNIVSSLTTENYDMALWSHHTYALENLPERNFNKSLPKHLFKFSQPSDYAKYFVSYQYGKIVQLEANDQLFSMFTVYTMYIDSKKPLKIQFKFQSFKEQVYFQQGKVHINFPYEEISSGLEQLLQITILSQQQNVFHAQEKNMSLQVQFPTINDHFYGESSPCTDYTPKQCKFCTFVNVGRTQCEMCDNKLD